MKLHRPLVVVTDERCRFAMKASLKILALCIGLMLFTYALRCLVIAVHYKQMQVSALPLGEDAPAYARDWSMYFTLISWRVKSGVNWAIALWSLGLLLPSLRKRVALYSAALGVAALVTVGLDESWRFPPLITTLVVSCTLPFVAILFVIWLALEEGAP